MKHATELGAMALQRLMAPGNESASVLLEHIRAERTAQLPAPRRGRPRRAGA